jgi:hypothetical protein
MQLLMGQFVSVNVKLQCTGDRAHNIVLSLQAPSGQEVLQRVFYDFEWSEYVRFGEIFSCGSLIHQLLSFWRRFQGEIGPWWKLPPKNAVPQNAVCLETFGMMTIPHWCIPSF